MDGFNVRVVKREKSEPKRHRVPNKVVKYLSGKLNGSIEPAYKPDNDKYYELLYFYLKASTDIPEGLRVDKRKFRWKLVEWLKKLLEDYLELVRVLLFSVAKNGQEI